MVSLIATLVRSAFRPRPEIFCSASVWDAGVSELRLRAAGRRESGAFLLGSNVKGRRIERFVFYDDIDADALKTGIVKIDGRRLGRLWEMCRYSGLKVVADIHVHPKGFRQSDSDRANPIIAEIGHIAIILPDFAAKATSPGKIGIHQYLGSRSWQDRSTDRPSPLHIGWWPEWL